MYIASAIAFMLLVTYLINTVQAAWQEPKTWVFENNSFSGIQENRQDNLSEKEGEDNGNDGTWDANTQYGEARVTTNHQLSVASSEKTKGSTSHIEALIRKKFENKETIVAVFKAESGHDPRSMNWNCRYTNERKETVSKACKPEDRDKAWSVDCGLAQINTVGKDCPEELFDPEHNLTVAKKMYDARGLNPWMAYLNGSFKKYLE
jgi:hypothetical protein